MNELALGSCQGRRPSPPTPHGRIDQLIRLGIEAVVQVHGQLILLLRHTAPDLLDAHAAVGGGVRGRGGRAGHTSLRKAHGSLEQRQC